MGESRSLRHRSDAAAGNSELHQGTVRSLDLGQTPSRRVQTAGDAAGAACGSFQARPAARDEGDSRVRVERGEGRAQTDSLERWRIGDSWCGDRRAEFERRVDKYHEGQQVVDALVRQSTHLSDATAGG